MLEEFAQVTNLTALENQLHYIYILWILAPQTYLNEPPEWKLVFFKYYIQFSTALDKYLVFSSTQSESWCMTQRLLHSN